MKKIDYRLELEKLREKPNIDRQTLAILEGQIIMLEALGAYRNALREMAKSVRQRLV